MLFIPSASNAYDRQNSWGTARPLAARQTTASAGSGGAFGLTVQVGSALAADSWGMIVHLHGIALSGSGDHSSAIKLRIDTAGGTSWADWVGPLLAGSSGFWNHTGTGNHYYLPLFAPAGSAIAAAAASSQNAKNCGIGITHLANPAGIAKTGSVAEVIGSTGNHTATSITPGTTSEGAWVSLGTTVAALWSWSLGLQIVEKQHNQNAVHVDLAVGDGTTKDLILTDCLFGSLANEQSSMVTWSPFATYPVPAGSTIYARAQASGTLDGTYQISAYGVGG